ncbi:MAG TPA: response regulator [Arenibaculum sp.]|nr:response regulator [Arenibaculum sp.]
MTDVLVVEDDLLIADDIMATLETAGYDVIGPARSACEALDIAAAHPPDIAVLDIRIDGPVDGIDLAWALKAAGITAIIFVSGSGEPSTLNRAREVHPVAFLHKPLAPGQLVASMHKALAPATLP